jgi:hypothetical protein
MSKLWFRPIFVCPQCSFESFDANVIRLQYCPRCHELVGQPDNFERFWDAPNPNDPKGKDTTVK